MKKAKMIFQQTLMISTGILFSLGVQMLLAFLFEGVVQESWPWYIPLSIVSTGFVTALPSVFLLDDDEAVTQRMMWRKIIIHFFVVLGIVSGAGYIFRWYTTLQSYMMIFIIYVLVYVFVWIASLWIGKSDERAINQFLNDIRDEE